MCSEAYTSGLYRLRDLTVPTVGPQRFPEPRERGSRIAATLPRWSTRGEFVAWGPKCKSHVSITLNASVPESCDAKWDGAVGPDRKRRPEARISAACGHRSHPVRLASRWCRRAASRIMGNTVCRLAFVGWFLPPSWSQVARLPVSTLSLSGGEPRGFGGKRRGRRGRARRSAAYVSRRREGRRAETDPRLRRFRCARLARRATPARSAPIARRRAASRTFVTTLRARIRSRTATRPMWIALEARRCRAVWSTKGMRRVPRLRVGNLRRGEMNRPYDVRRSNEKWIGDEH